MTVGAFFGAGKCQDISDKAGKIILRNRWVEQGNSACPVTGRLKCNELLDGIRRNEPVKTLIETATDFFEYVRDRERITELSRNAACEGLILQSAAEIWGLGRL